MANRYLVATGNWIDTACWSATDGGSPGASYPTTADDVYLTATSGAVTLTTNTACGCKIFDCTGFTGTFNNSYVMTCSGLKFYLSSTMTVSITNSLNLNPSSGTCLITTNGKTLGAINAGSSGSATYIFQDNISCTSLTSTNGTLDFNDRTVSCTALNCSSGGSILLKNSTINISSNNPVNINASGSLNSGTSVININYSAATCNFQGGGKTFYNVNFNNGNNNTVNITGSNTFNIFNVASQKRMTFASGTTQTVGDFTATGSPSALITLKSNSAGSSFTLSKSSGTVNCDYLSIQDSTATGGATWYAGNNSTNVSNNSGWIFSGTSVAWSKNLSESVSISDTFGKNFASSILDSTVIDETRSETASGRINRGITDIVSVSDSITKSIGVNSFDSVNLSDFNNKSVSTTKSESSTISDSISKKFYTYKVETITSSDSLSKGMGITKIDSLATSDSQTTPNKKSINDIVNISEALSKVSRFVKTINDNAVMVDQITKVVAYHLSLSDAVLVEDNPNLVYNKYFRTYIVYEENKLKIVVNGNVVQTWQ